MMGPAERATIAGDLAAGFHLIPQHMWEGVMRYVNGRQPVGHFLTALFANDLMETMARADELNAAAIKGWCQFVYNHCPSPCHGSYEKVEAWLAEGPTGEDAVGSNEAMTGLNRARAEAKAALP